MPKLIFHDSDGIDRAVDLSAEPALIGRASECQVQTQDALVSRRHARIVWDGGYWIEDLGSSNGVYVDGERVQRAPLRPGDEVRCGSLVMRLVPEVSRSRPQSLSARAPVQTAPQTPPLAPAVLPSPPMPQELPPRAVATIRPAAPLLPTSDAGGNPQLDEERSRRVAAEAAVLTAEQRAATAEGKLRDAEARVEGAVERAASAEAQAARAAQLEQAGRQAEGYRRQIEQLRAELRRLQRGDSADEVTNPDVGPSPAMVAELTSQRDELRVRVGELEAQLARAAGGGGDDGALLRRRVDQLTAELRRIRGGVAPAPADDGRIADLEARLARAEQERDALRRAPPAAAATVAVAAAAALYSIGLIDDALADLRGSLRAANDEAGVLGVEAPSDSVQVLKDALLSASEQMEAARARVKEARALFTGK